MAATGGIRRRFWARPCLRNGRRTGTAPLLFGSGSLTKLHDIRSAGGHPISRGAVEMKAPRHIHDGAHFHENLRSHLLVVAVGVPDVHDVAAARHIAFLIEAHRAQYALPWT